MSNGLQGLRVVYKMALFGGFLRIFGVILAAARGRFGGKIFAVLADFARSHPQTCKMEGLTASLAGDQVTRSRGVRPLVGVSGAKPLSGGWGLLRPSGTRPATDRAGRRDKPQGLPIIWRKERLLRRMPAFTFPAPLTLPFPSGQFSFSRPAGLLPGRRCTPWGRRQGLCPGAR